MNRVQDGIRPGRDRHGDSGTDRQDRSAKPGRSWPSDRDHAGNVAARRLSDGILQFPDLPGPDARRLVGRPGELVSISPDFTHLIGVDAGFGFVLALRMNRCGDVIAVERLQRNCRTDRQTSWHI